MTLQHRSISDYHIHSPYCGHALGKMIEYVEQAIEKGMAEICFTDHLGRYYLSESQKKRYWDWGMNSAKLARYITEVTDLAYTFRDQIIVHRGLEIDYIEGADELLAPFLTANEFDFLLGSVHCLPQFGWKHLAHYSGQDVWPLFEEYFEAAQQIVSSGRFNSLAHLDFIWRYAKWPLKKADQIFDSIETITKMAAQHNVAIEINSNGYLWSQIYTVPGGDPFEVMLSKIKQYRTPITIGSDAHKPEFVGKAFKELGAQLKSKGITQYSTFEKQHPRLRPIPT